MTDVSPAGAISAASEELVGPTPPRRHDTPLGMAAGALWMRELRARMRGRKAFIFITIYLSLLVGLMWLALRALDDQYLSALEQVSVGRGIFVAVVLVETLVVVALAPAYTAGAISQERERQTFDLLAITPVSSLSIVLGKLLSGLSYLALIVGVSIPIASVAFVFGGIDPETFVLAYGLIAVTAIGVGAIGIACSAVMRRTQAATVGAFILVGAIVVGASVGWAVYSGLAASRELDPPPDALLYLNPFLAQADVLCAATGTACMSGVTVAVDMAEQGEFPSTAELAARSGGFWPKSAVSWILLTAGALFIATQALVPSRRWRPGLPRPRSAPLP
jgi:ABC-type transport system involved in multi-copper enzyme maturation permease subunit